LFETAAEQGFGSVQGKPFRSKGLIKTIKNCVVELLGFLMEGLRLELMLGFLMEGLRLELVLGFLMEGLRGCWLTAEWLMALSSRNELVVGLIVV
jgi:hypothetical protein